jgi:hypothetical protein
VARAQLRDGREGVVRVEEVRPAAPDCAGSPPARFAVFQHARYVLTPTGGGGDGDDSGDGGGGGGWAFVPAPRVAPEVAARLPHAAAALRAPAGGGAGGAAAGFATAAAAAAFHDDPAARAAAAARHGPNTMVVPVPPLARSLLVSLLHPFCLFQYASVIIWCFEEYYVYSALRWSLIAGDDCADWAAPLFPVLQPPRGAAASRHTPPAVVPTAAPAPPQPNPGGVILAITLATYTATAVSDWRTARRMAAMALFT